MIDERFLRETLAQGAKEKKSKGIPHRVMSGSGL